MSVIGKNINRIKNILSGDYTSGTQTMVGHTKKYVKHKEGDVWEENGKKWTIIDGIKQNVTKMDKFRTMFIIPYACSCGHALKGEFDKNSWRTYKKCFNCRIDEETLMRLDNTFTENKISAYKKNAMAFLNDAKKEYTEFLLSNTLTSYVTETGVVEDWYGGKDQSELIDKVEKEFAELKNKIESI